MSIKSIEKFYIKIKNNPELKKELEDLKNNLSLGRLSPINAEEFIEKGIIPLAKKYGIDFSMDDLMDYASENHAKILEARKDILSEEELIEVSGGSNQKAVDLFLCLKWMNF